MRQISLRSGCSDGAEHVWHVKHAYRKETFLCALLAIFSLARGLWAPAASMALAIALLWAVRWVLCSLLPRLVRWGWIQLRGLCGSRAV